MQQISENTTALPRSRRRLLRGLIYLAVLAAVLWLVGRTLLDQFGHFDWAHWHANVPLLAGGMLLIGLHEFLCGVTLRLSIQSFGQSAPLRATVAAYWSSSLAGKYIPGKVATVAGAAAVLAAFGVRTTVALGATFLHTALNALIGLTIALFGCPPLLAGSAGRLSPAAWIVAGLLAAAALACLHPRIFIALGNVALARLGREPIVTRPRNRFLLATAAVTVVRFAVLGAGCWLVARSVAAADMKLDLLPLMIAVTAGATVIGFLAVFAPAGIGVREGIYMFMLTPALGGPAAALVAVFMRLAQTVVEVVVGLIGLAMLRKPGPPPGEEGVRAPSGEQ